MSAALLPEGGPLAWAASGRAVFPCTPQTKTPATARGFQDGTTDAAQLRAWAVRWPGCNWACWPGPGGECVLDFDPAHGDGAGRAMLAQLGDVTAAVTTAAAGVHLWFRLPPGVTLGNGRGGLPAGWDVRAHSGYVLLPGSVVSYRGDAAARKGVPEGYRGRYELQRAGPVAELPADVLALILQPRGVTKTNNEAHKPDAPPGDFTPVRKSPALGDAEVIAVARRLPSGAKFARLWGGDVTGYASTSEAVKALVNLLTFVTQDPAQVDRLFRQSELCKLYERWGRLAQHEILESLATRRAWWHAASGG